MKVEAGSFRLRVDYPQRMLTKVSRAKMSFIGSDDLCDISNREPVRLKAADDLTNQSRHFRVELGGLASSTTWLLAELDIEPLPSVVIDQSEVARPPYQEGNGHSPPLLQIDESSEVDIEEFPSSIDLGHQELSGEFISLCLEKFAGMFIDS